MKLQSKKMGKTYYKNSKKFEDDVSGKRSGKATGKKGGGMKTLNNYVDEYYDLEDDTFQDEVELKDDIKIQHDTNTK